MAKSPTELDLRSTEYRASSPNIRMPALDYSPIAGSAKAGTGVAGLSQGVHALVKSQEEQDAYEVQRKLLDWKLETEMAHEEYRRTMPAGGDGYVEGWQKEFQKRAGSFVGKGDANVPAHLRGRVGNAMKSFEVQLGERAQREALAERDRFEVEQLTGTLGKAVSAVSSNPDRIEEMHTEGSALIDASRLTPAAKATQKKTLRKTLEEAAAGTIVDGVRDADSLERARSLLRPDAPDRITAKGVKANIVNQGEHSVISTGSGAKFRVSSTHSDRFAGLIADLEAEGIEIKGDQSGGYANRTIRGTNTPSKHSHGEAIDINWGENAEGKPGALSARLGDEKIRALAAKHGLKWGGDFKGRSRDDMHFEVDRSLTPQSVPAAGPEPSNVTFEGEPTVDESQSGPIRSLTQAQRRAFWQRAQGNFEKVKAGIDQVIKDQTGVAQQGYAPPAPVMDELRRQVAATKDPMLAARLQVLEHNVVRTQQLQAAPPLAIEEHVRKQREYFAQHGATKEQLAQLEHDEKLGVNVRKASNEDPMGYAAKIRLNVPFADGPPADLEPAHRAQWKMPIAPVELEQIDFRSQDIDRMLATRADQAKAVGRYYGQPAQMFTKNEREFLKDTLRKGGDGMLFVLGKIAVSAARAGIEPSVVMKEFSKDAPEVAVIGEMVANNADPTIQKTAAAALAWRTAQGEKFVSTIDKLQAQPDLSEYADVLSTTPLRVDAVKQTANLLYEYEARRNGVTQFDGTLYKSVLRRIMGETTDGQGNTYGGVGKQGSGWFDGKWSSKVFVPAEVRQDSFDDMVGALRARDIPDPPVDSTGKTLSMTDIRRATWVSVGNGQYLLQHSVGADGTKVLYANRSGQPYVVDVRPLLPDIRKRKPEIFRGYDGLQRGRAEPDPEYASGMAP